MRRWRSSCRFGVALVCAGALGAACTVADREGYSFGMADQGGSGGAGTGFGGGGAFGTAGPPAAAPAGGRDGWSTGGAGGSTEPILDGEAGAPDATASEPRPGTSEMDPALGGPCSEEDALLCPALAARELWICLGGTWRLYTECVDGDVCSDDGPRCKPITPLCVGREPGERFCDGTTLHTCAKDLLSTTAADCEERCIDGECAPETCGNGVLDEDEDCDDGNADNTDDCLSSCREATCGDGFVREGIEECDDGNDADDDACPTTCLAAVCGDGFVHGGMEECDDGNDSDEDDCLSSCKAPVCGNGVKEGAEECDDGNSNTTDDCTSLCKRPACGDGFVHSETEQCDDGDPSGGPCRANCTWAAVAIDAGTGHVCALMANDGLKCWGNNAFGQLGVAETPVPDRKQTLATLPDSVSVFDAGEATTCAVHRENLLCWGHSIAGIVVYTNLPNQVFPGFRPRQVAVTGWHICAIDEQSDRLKCWGIHGGGALGVDHDDELIGDDEPLQDIPYVELDGAVRAVTVGERLTCALLEAGVAKCWGNNEYGQLGLGSDDASRGLPSGNVVVGDSFEISKIVASYRHVCALSAMGEVKCWGANESGQLGYGDTEDRGRTPASMGNGLPVVPLGSPVLDVAVGATSSCAVLSDGAVKCWGAALSGQLGQPALTHAGGAVNNLGDEPGELQTLPPIDLGAGARAIQVAMGYDFACALLDDGGVKCWGFDIVGDQTRVTYGQGIGDVVGEMGEALPEVPLN